MYVCAYICNLQKNCLLYAIPQHSCFVISFNCQNNHVKNLPYFTNKETEAQVKWIS